MSVGVHRLLADESDDVLTEFLVLDQRKSFLEGLDKPFLTGGEEKVKHVENVCAERIAGIQCMGRSDQSNSTLRACNRCDPARRTTKRGVDIFCDI